MRAALAWLSLGALWLSSSRALGQDPALEPALRTPVADAGAPPELESPPAATPSEPAASAQTAEIEALRREMSAMQARLAELENQTALAQLESGDESAIMELTEPLLSIYGFIDFGFDRWFLKGKADDDVGILRPTRESSFVFGNLNLYIDATLDPKWQTLIEVRFTLAPHGEEIGLDPPIGTSYARIDTTAFDYSSPSAQSQLRLASVFIERAYQEWKPYDLFRLRAGMFLNPFGIWNVDHGSPTLIALSLPTFVAGQMMPGRLLGLQALGGHTWGAKRFEYALHVSNGRTPLDFDLTDDKALGARLSLSLDWQPADLTLGASTYHGTYEDQHKVIDPVAASMDRAGFFDWETVVAYREHVWGADASLDVGDLRLRAEAVARWVYYEEGKREQVFIETGGARYLPDRMEWDTYLIAAYRTPWKLEPYLMLEGAQKSFVLPRFAGDARATAADVKLVAPSVGLNVRVTSRVMVKAQGQMIRAFNGPQHRHLWDVYTIYTRLVSSF